MANENDGDDAARSEDPARLPFEGGAPPAGEAGGLLARLLAVWRNPAYRFVLLFLPYLGVVSIGYPLIVSRYSQVIQVFIRATALIEYALFAPFTANIKVDDRLVLYHGFAVTIIDECTGIYEILIFSAAVLSFPTSWRKRLIGLAFGCPLIYLFNVLRIAMLILVGRHYPAAFDFMHLYFWQATMIVMITSVWLLWIIKVVRGDEEPAAAPA